MSVFSRIFQRNRPPDPPKPDTAPHGDSPERTEAAKPEPAAPASTSSHRPNGAVGHAAASAASAAPIEPAPAAPVQARSSNGKSESTLVWGSPSGDVNAPIAPRPEAPRAARPQAPPSPPAPKSQRGSKPVLPAHKPPVPPRAPPAAGPASTRAKSGGAVATERRAPAARKVTPNSTATAPMDDVDAAFGNMLDMNRTSSPEGAQSAAPAAPPPDVRELFVAIAAHHMRPLRGVMLSLKWGEPVPNPAAICVPIVSSLMSAAGQMGFASLHAALAQFAITLGAGTNGDATLGAAAREALLSQYAKLSNEMPDVFALEGEQNRREAIIVHSLLHQIPGNSHLAVHKIYAAGLANLDMMLLAEADAIVSTTGIDPALASRIVDKFQAYRRETRDAAASSRETERKRLASLALELRRLHEEFEQIASAWTGDAGETKKGLRQARNDVFLQVKVLLARLGELEQLEELERLPFQGRIERLETYLRDDPGKSPTGETLL